MMKRTSRTAPGLSRRLSRRSDRGSASNDVKIAEEPLKSLEVAEGEYMTTRHLLKEKAARKAIVVKRKGFFNFLLSRHEGPIFAKKSVIGCLGLSP